LADEDELELPVEHAKQTLENETVAAPAPVVWAGALGLLAALSRLVYLFGFANPENTGEGFTDAYHHWQIAYLTKEVGLAHGPRLWDMRGWEYVWGLLHPLLMNVLFFATGSTDIVLARLLSLFFGSIAVVLIFLLCNRYWGLPVALCAGAFAALSPVSIFNDVAGMAEPLGIALVLLGIWLLPRNGFWAGAALALAATARAEAWLFGAGLVVAWVLGAPRWNLPRAPLLFGWLIGMTLYGKWLFDQLGSPVYPLTTNFAFVGLGAGGTGGQSAHDPVLWIPFIVAALVCALCLVWVLRRQPPSYLLLVYGFGYSGLSLATYLRYATEWKERRFEFPLDFAVILITIFLIKWLPSRTASFRPLSAPAAAAVVLAAQAFWIPVQSTYAATEAQYRYMVSLAHVIGATYNRPENREGVLNMPGDEPTLLYLLVRDENLRGDRITSQFYDPFYYLPAGYSYTGHHDVVGPILQCWFSQTHTRLLLISPPGPLSRSNADYRAFIADHPDWFQDSGSGIGDGWSLIQVNVPAVSAAECARARELDAAPI
jgi:hypothetical protein